MGTESRLSKELWNKLMVFHIEDIFVLESSPSVKTSRSLIGHFAASVLATSPYSDDLVTILCDVIGTVFWGLSTAPR